MQIQYISAGQSELIQLVSIVSKWKLSEWILFRDINDRIEWGVDIQNQAVYIKELALTKKHLAITKQTNIIRECEHDSKWTHWFGSIEFNKSNPMTLKSLSTTHTHTQFTNGNGGKLQAVLICIPIFSIFFFPVKQTEREEKIIIIESTNWGSEKAQQKERLGHEWLHTRWKKKLVHSKFTKNGKIILFIYFVAFIPLVLFSIFSFRFRCFCSVNFLHFITEILFCTYTQSTLYSYTIAL